MKQKLLYLAGLLVVLWGAWFFYTSAERRALSVPEHRDFFWTDSLAVDSLAVKFATWTHLARRNGRWVVFATDETYLADEEKIARVLRTNNEMVLENVISSHAEKFDKFNVDTLHGTILKTFAGGRPLAAFVLGKISGDMRHTYVRRLASDSVFMARGEFAQVYTKAPSEWRSPVIFDLDSALIDTIIWIEPDRGETRLLRTPNRDWVVWKPGIASPMPVDTSIANLKIRRLSPLRADAFPPEGNYGVPTFDTLGLQLIVHTTDGHADTLVWNRFAENENRSYAMRPGHPRPVYIFFKGSYDRLLGRYETLVQQDTTKIRP